MKLRPWQVENSIEHWNVVGEEGGKEDAFDIIKALLSKVEKDSDPSGIYLNVYYGPDFEWFGEMTVTY